MPIISEALRFIVYLWSIVLAVVSGLLALLASLAPVSLTIFVSTVWGFVIVCGLFGAALILNIVGVEDVHGTLNRVLSDDGGGVELTAVEEAVAIDPAAVTDDRGHFSQSAFETATGMTPTEFTHLYLQWKGGRVKQASLNRCLPWSKTTVVRYVDDLESEGLVVRVKIGRENIICTPEKVPDGTVKE